MEKVTSWVEAAVDAGFGLVAFGEALAPRYPFWVELTDGARFNSPLQKEIFAEYAEQAARRRIAVYLGCIERAVWRGGHSLYCSLVFIGADGRIGSVHRKMMPTYEERLVWSAGDGHGLRTHVVGAFHAGGLNCWENWMPLSRTALYAQGEDLHIALAGQRAEYARHHALHRAGIAVVCGECVGADAAVGDRPRERMAARDGGRGAGGAGERRSCLAGPDGEWVIAPAGAEETLLTATIDFRRVLEERQNFDASGHYARPDVTRLKVDRRRQVIARFVE